MAYGMIRTVAVKKFWVRLPFVTLLILIELLPINTDIFLDQKGIICSHTDVMFFFAFQGNVLPTPPPIPPQIARALEYIARSAPRQ